MNKRLLCLGVAAAAFQLLATGCHPVARWRANHPYWRDGCADCRPLLPRRSLVVGEPVAGPVVGGPVVDPPCHGCNSGPVAGVPVSYGPVSGDVMPVTHPPGVYPNITRPLPIQGGPTVVPQYELPTPMPVTNPKGDGK